MITNTVIARRLLCATALCAGVVAMPAHAATDPATATDPAPATNPADDQKQDANGGLSEIVVVAQKREENLQKTPISISVLKAEDIGNRHIQSLLDLQDGSIPSLRILPFSGRPFSLVLNIRGVGVLGDSNQPARDGGVGVYVDGVYLGRPQGLNSALYDVESIEVLKGPQGTLFGRNTEGGALNIVTKKPTGKFGLSILGGVGNYGSYESELHLNLPETHNFSLKVDGLITTRGGTVRNTYPGASNFNAYDRRGARAQLLWKPLSNLSALYAYDYVNDASTVGYTQRVQAGTGFVPAVALQPTRADVVDYGVPLQPSIGSQSGHLLTVQWQALPHLMIKSISSYRELAQNQFDGGGFNNAAYVIQAAPTGIVQRDNVDGRYSLAAFYQYQYSQELQAIGEIGRVKYVVGGLAYYEHVRDQAQAFNVGYLDTNGNFIVQLPGPTNLINNQVIPGTTTPLPITNAVTPLYPYAGVDRASIARTQSYGVFGQATWTPAIFDDRLHLTGGIRWTYDLKKGTLLITNNYPPLNRDTTYRPIDFRGSWKRVDPMVNIAVDVTHDLQVYGKWSTGYKSGGANSRSLNYRAFDPESVSVFELGLKSEFLDHHVRFNIAGYTGIYKNQQVDFSVPYYCFSSTGTVIPCVGSVITTRTTTNTYNTPVHGKISGVETELTIAPVRGLTLSGQYTYAYVRVGAAVDPYCETQASGACVIDLTPRAQQGVLTPVHSASGQIDYEMPLGDFTFNGHIDGAWDSGSFNSSNPNAVGVYNPRSQPGLIINSRVSLGDIKFPGSDAKMTVSFWVRNLFDEQHLVSRNYSIGTGISGYFNDPRTFGGQVSVKF
ncbi:MAG: TonB-dependent receptor [Sphingomonas sp.]